MKKYVLGTVKDAHCMFCRIPWEREFFDSMLPISFRLKDYKEHRENILCDREKSRLPETQALCDTVKQREEQIDDTIAKLTRKNASMHEELRVLSAKYGQQVERNLLAMERHRLRKKRFALVLAGQIDTVAGDEGFVQETRLRAGRFTMQCPLNTCNGLLNERFVCGVCSERVCRRCHVARGKHKVTLRKSHTLDKNKSNDDANKDKGKAPASVESAENPLEVAENETEDEDEEEDVEGCSVKHICDPDTVATIKHLRMASKGCPGCGTRISKIDGCDQMWCISCHTAFSWKTGEKVHARAVVHNPHFYEWKRNNGGLAAGAVDMNGCPVGHAVLNSVMQNIRKLTGCIEHRFISCIHQEITHIQQVVMVPEADENMTDPTRELRIRYMKGLISEENWKIALQRYEKKRCKRVETLQVYQMYTATMTDLFHKIAAARTLAELDQCRKEMSSMCKLVSLCMSNISRRYGQTCGTYALWDRQLDAHPYFTTVVPNFTKTTT